MKTISKLGLLMVLAFATMSSYAIDGDFLLNVKKGNGKLIGFSINGIKKVNVSIYDKNNALIYSEYVTGKEGIKRTYSLEEFPEGTYYLVVENNLKKVKYVIVVNDKLAEMSRKSVVEVYKASVDKNRNLANAN